MAVRLEGDTLHLRMAAVRAAIPPLLKADRAKAGAKAQVTEHGVSAPMDVHFLSVLRAGKNLVPFQLPCSRQIFLSDRVTSKVVLELRNPVSPEGK